MSTPDYDDPAVEERWCAQRRDAVTDYLKRQHVEHGEVGEWPAWHVAPYVSIWAIESKKKPGWVGWWVISGDLPSDYISAERITHPREALRAVAQRWLEVARCMQDGRPHPTVVVGDPDPSNQATLAPLLEKRGTLLLQWSNDDACWGPEYD
jgi:hypothetical protein